MIRNKAIIMENIIMRNPPLSTKEYYECSPTFNKAKEYHKCSSTFNKAKEYHHECSSTFNNEIMILKKQGSLMPI